MAKKSPLQLVKELHGNKEKLVHKLVELVEKSEETKEQLVTRLQAAPNSKLLRLHDVLTTIKQTFGSQDKLVSAVAAGLNKAKDADYVKKLQSYTPSKLLDLYNNQQKKARRAS